MKTKRPYVTWATQSPLNPLQWLLSLSCGHEKWATQKKRPADRKYVDCADCRRNADNVDGAS